MVLAAIDSNWCAPVGPDLDAFEAEVAAVTGRAFGVALSSGTAGLHLALLELGVGPGDEVLVSTFTFVATANAVAYCGATPVFIDSEPETWNMSADLLAEELEVRRSAGRPMPAAAIVVDLYGQCADY
jgi:dTDP-4-amino-4,6-dideoxygalactose transaminase